jgi:hypothetical protein
VLDVNGKMSSEKKMLMDRWKEYFKGKLNNHGQLNIDFHMEEFDINVTNKEITESRYLRDEVLNFKHRKETRTNYCNDRDCNICDSYRGMTLLSCIAKYYQV